MGRQLQGALYLEMLLARSCCCSNQRQKRQNRVARQQDSMRCGIYETEILARTPLFVQLSSLVAYHCTIKDQGGRDKRKNGEGVGFWLISPETAPINKSSSFVELYIYPSSTRM